MNPRNIFGFVIRLVGLYLTLMGLWYLAYAAGQVCGAAQDTPHEMVGYFVAGVPSLLLGLVFLRFARQIVRFTYPGNRDDSDPDAT